jgi:hypothetical protein
MSDDARTRRRDESFNFRLVRQAESCFPTSMPPEIRLAIQLTALFIVGIGVIKFVGRLGPVQRFERWIDERTKERERRSQIRTERWRQALLGGHAFLPSSAKVSFLYLAVLGGCCGMLWTAFFKRRIECSSKGYCFLIDERAETVHLGTPGTGWREWIEWRVEAPRATRPDKAKVIYKSEDGTLYDRIPEGHEIDQRRDDP